MKNQILRFLFGLLLGATMYSAAQASSPGEKVICTDKPRSTWISESQIRKIFGESDFALTRFKVSRGNCYEFYAVAHDGSIVEAYYHPVSGKRLRHNRVTATSSESRTD